MYAPELQTGASGAQGLNENPHSGEGNEGWEVRPKQGQTQQAKVTLQSWTQPSGVCSGGWMGSPSLSSLGEPDHGSSPFPCALTPPLFSPPLPPPPPLSSPALFPHPSSVLSSSAPSPLPCPLPYSLLPCALTPPLSSPHLCPHPLPVLSSPAPSLPSLCPHPSPVLFSSALYFHPLSLSS